MDRRVAVDEEADRVAGPMDSAGPRRMASGRRQGTWTRSLRCHALLPGRPVDRCSGPGGIRDGLPRLVLRPRDSHPRKSACGLGRRQCGAYRAVFLSRRPNGADRKDGTLRQTSERSSNDSNGGPCFPGSARRRTDGEPYSPGQIERRRLSGYRHRRGGSGGESEAGWRWRSRAALVSTASICPRRAAKSTGFV
jgi:hypothetical protein